MRKLADIKGDDAFVMLADLIEPAANIMSDPEVKEAYYGKNLAAAVSVAIKNHTKEAKTIVAIMQEENPDTYEPKIMELPAIALQLMNDPEMKELFTLPEQMIEEDTSGSASESSEVKE